MVSRKQIQPKGPRARTTADREIGLRIRAMRTDQNISQDELGSKLGVSFQQIQKYEKGVNRIAAGRLMEIARALETTPHELMGWDGAAKVGGEIVFDVESYKLAKAFSELPDVVKPTLRSLINTVIASQK